MFTSRAEFRTLLRQDNADLRLTEISYRLGLADQDRMDKVIAKRESVQQIKEVLQQTSLEPEEINGLLESVCSSPLYKRQKAAQILLRPNLSLLAMIKAVPKLSAALSGYDTEILEQAEIQIKYDTYIEKEKELVTKMSLLEDLRIPENFDYEKLVSLGTEAKQKFKKIRPHTLGQASRISGVNPSDVQILMVFMGR